MLTLPALRAHPAVQLSAAHDLRDEALVRFESQFGATVHRTYEALLADSGVDAVYIATPHELHAAQAIAALEAGKHVLVEKPMATSVGDCAAMARAAEKAGRVLMVGPSHAFDEPVRVAAELVASGRYGKVRLVNAFNYTDFMYRPRRPEELDSERGGGVVYSQAAHQIDVVRRIVRQPVESIRAVAANWDASRPSEGAYSALMTFASGTVATLTYSGYAHYDSDELLGWISELGRPKDPVCYGEARKALKQLSQQDEINAKLARTFGSASAGDPASAPHHEHFGFVLVSCERADLKLLPASIEVFGDERRETIPIAAPTLPRANVIEDFVASIVGARPPVHDGWWGLETMACCAALLESSRIAADVKPQTIIQES